MSAGDNRRSVVVGIFIILGLVILVAGILVLGGQQKRFTSSIRITAVFKDVGGLRAGNNVWFSGVKIGTVKRVHFLGNAQVEVEMNVEKSSQDYIRKNANATISSDGLIGNRIVEIFGGTTQAEPIEEGDRLQTREALSSDELLETLQENNQNLLRVTNDVKDLLGNIKRGKGTVGAVLTDSVLASNFRRTMNNLQQASENTVQLSGAVTQFAGKLNKQGGLANELVTDTVVFSRIRSSIGQLEQVATKAQETVSTLSQASGKLNQASSKLTSNNNALGTLLNDEEASRNLKTTLRNLNRGSQLLNEDLEAAQHNFLLRGFFKKRDKERAKQQKEQEQSGVAPKDSVQ